MEAFCEKRFALPENLKKELVGKYPDDRGYVATYHDYGIQFLGNANPNREQFALLIGSNLHPFGWRIELELPYRPGDCSYYHLGLDIYGGSKLSINIWSRNGWENIAMTFDGQKIEWIFKDTGERVSNPFDRLDKHSEDDQFLVAQFSKQLPKKIWQNVEPLYADLQEFYVECCREWFKVVKK